ncbi:MAG: hypothetical protein JKY70_03070 [Mucilaginibacter sp.]|nr:hypothetical protein [Mucilaginibacter sp.]
MTPLSFQFHQDLCVVIIPDTLAHLDGHTVITHTYSIFKDTGLDEQIFSRSKESLLHLEKIDDPNYYGYLTFEIPDKLFTYTADGDNTLSAEEVEQLIEFLSDVRSNPELWRYFDER